MLSPRTASSVRVGFQMLRVNPMRTIISTLGVIMGVAALVAVLALGDGMEDFARRTIEKTTSLQAVAVVVQGGRTVDGVFIPDSVVPRVTMDDALAIGRLPGVREVMMMVEGPAIVTRSGAAGTERATNVFGTLASTWRREGMRVQHGRFFTDAEATAGARVAVINRRLATTLAGAGAERSLVGDTLRFQGTPFVVVGVLESELAPGPVAAVPFAASSIAMAPATRARLPQMAAVAARVEDVLPVKAAIERWAAAAHPDWRGRVTVRTQEARAQQVEQGILVFKLFMGALTGVSLLVGGIGIMNVLLASVTERTREIGIRKATGARRRDILVQFLAESVAITGAGSALGVVLGLGGALAATAIMRQMSKAEIHAGFSWSTFAVAAVSSVVVGLAFGTYPALRAARLSPVEAMQRE